MSTIEHALPVEAHHALRGFRYLLDSLLACAGSLLVTGIIYAFHLYPRIPNISIVYLLVILVLASCHSRHKMAERAFIAVFGLSFARIIGRFVPKGWPLAERRGKCSPQAGLPLFGTG